MNFETSYSPKRKHYPEIGTPDIRRKITEELRSARKFHEMSLEQISGITKINISYLKNIEEGRWSFLPMVYVKLFIKAYADSVGVQSEEFLNRLNEVFDSALPRVQLIDSQESDISQTQNVRQLHGSSFFVWAERNRAILFYGAIIIIAVAIIVFYLIRPPKMQMDEINNTSTDISSDTIRVDTSFVLNEDITKVDTTIPVEPEVKTFRPVFIAEDYCYIRIEHGDSILYDKKLWPGNNHSVEYPYPIRVILENAPQTRIVVGTDTIGFPSFPDTRVIRLGPDGIIR